jgi:hypothetical protein
MDSFMPGTHIVVARLGRAQPQHTYMMDESDCKQACGMWNFSCRPYAYWVARLVRAHICYEGNQININAKKKNLWDWFVEVRVKACDMWNVSCRPYA